MTIPQSSRNYTLSSGSASSIVPEISNRSPSSTDIKGSNGPFQIGQRWINKIQNLSYTLTSLTSSNGIISANWLAEGPGNGALSTLTGNTGGAISPTSGNINIFGANTITVSGSGSTLTINPSVSGYPITPYIVGPIGQAGYQTIQSAINAVESSSSGVGVVGIIPGTYTENLTITGNVSLFALVGNQGTSSLYNSPGGSDLVTVVGSISISNEASLTPTNNIIENIRFSPVGGTYIINVASFYSVTFVGCTFDANSNGINIFSADGFPYVFLDSCIINEATGITSNFLTFPNGQLFLNIQAQNCSFLTSSVNYSTYNPGGSLLLNLINCFYQTKIDISSSAGSVLHFNAINTRFDWTGATPLLNYGAQVGFMEIQNCQIDSNSSSLSSSTYMAPDGYFRIHNSFFNDTYNLTNNCQEHIYNSQFISGSDAAINMSSAGNVIISDCVIESSHNPAIIGAGSGTLTLSGINYINNSSLAGTLTLNTNSASIFGEVRANGDVGGSIGFNSLTGTNSTTIGSGNGSIKMSSANPGTNAAWIKIYIGTTAYWIPAWTTNSPLQKGLKCLFHLIHRFHLLLPQFLKKKKKLNTSLNLIASSFIGL